jgi:hypothetical protein
MMARELPSVVYNTAGYLGLFNMSGRKQTVRFDSGYLLEQAREVAAIWGTATPDRRVLSEVWDGRRLDLSADVTEVGPLGPYESLLFGPE